MTDLLLFAAWTAVLLAGILFVVWLRARGVAATYARDLLHVGAGVWVLGWPLWQGWLAPTLMVLAAAVVTAVVPTLAVRHRWARRFVDSISGGDERYAGLVHYVLAFAVLTPVALCWRPFPAAAALLALSWGDGPGGVAGRLLGKHRYRIGGGKTKSLEGSVVVGLGAALGTLVATQLFHVAAATSGVVWLLALGLGVTAALSEAAAPRSLDNAIVPAAVFTVAALASITEITP